MQQGVQAHRNGGRVGAVLGGRDQDVLTGEEIWAKLQNMNLHEVLQTLERAASSKP